MWTFVIGQQAIRTTTLEIEALNNEPKPYIGKVRHSKSRFVNQALIYESL